jgi:hypothetical protein
MSFDVTLAFMHVKTQISGSVSSTDRVIEHLEKICNSSAFLHSRRSQEFLRYVVLETLHGRADLIKERNIAHQVFGKGDDFEPSEYSLVRVKAGEVRKRLLDYYQSASNQDVWIELPLGSYVPRIHEGTEAAVHEASPETPVDLALDPAGRTLDRRRFFWIAGGTLGAAAIAATWTFLRPGTTPLDELWHPVFATKKPLLIFLPMVPNQNGELTEWVGVGPVSALRSATDFLDTCRYPYYVRFGADLTFSDLREHPSLLLGGFSRPWTRRMFSNLRYAPVEGDNRTERSFIDTQTKETWSAVIHPPSLHVDTDYGVVCRLFDPLSGQIVFLAVGTWTFGTEGAAALLFDRALFAGLTKRAPKNWEAKNFQAVIRVSVIGNTPSPPQIVASYFW